MAQPALATAEDIEGWLGQSDLEPEERVSAVLTAASTLVRSEARAAGWTIDDDDIPDEIVMVVTAAAARLWLNPKGVIQETTGPFTVQLGQAAAQGLYLTPEERRMIVRLGPKSKLWTLGTTRNDTLETGTVFADVAGTTERIPIMNREDPW